MIIDPKGTCNSCMTSKITKRRTPIDARTKITLFEVYHLDDLALMFDPPTDSIRRVRGSRKHLRIANNLELELNGYK